MRVWVDLTNSPHVLVMRPLIEAMRADGHEVEVTARDFAQTLELCERFGIDHTAVGRHRGGRLASKAVGLASRSGALARWARGRRFDVAMGHGSNDVSVAAALLRIPSATAFDYEFAAQQHHVNCRLCRVVMVPEAIPPERLAPLRRQAGQAPALRGPEGGVLPRRLRAGRDGSGGARARPRPAARGGAHAARRVALPPLREPAVPRACSSGSAASGAQTVVLPRTPQQREEVRRLGAFVVPERAVDAQSLVAFADLVISAGGTMNREAVALGTPVFTTFEGRLGAVDEALLRDGRLRRLADPDEVRVERRSGQDALRIRRDPRELVTLLLSAAES